MHKIEIDKLQEVDIWKYVKKHLNKKNLEICFIYKSFFKNTKTLRVFIEKIISNLWIEKTWISRFILITDELNNNAIEHGSTDWDINYMRLKINHSNNNKIININIEVEDSWKAQSHKTAKEMNEMKEVKISLWFNKYTSIRWRWLFLIIEKLVNNLYFKDDSKWWLIVWINKQIDKIK